MIDTIIMRIHGVQKHRNILKTLDRLNNKGYTTQTAKVDGKEVERLRNQGFHSQKEILDILKLNRTGEFLIKSQFAKHRNSSDHYTFNWMVNHTANYIEFNFSVPKYIYGSNILMFVPHTGDRDFAFGNCWELKPNLLGTAERLGRFLREFFKLEFPFIDVDPRDVEINRIDVCFNQVFRTQKDALKFLEYQKRQRKKYSRNEEGTMRDYETSLMYKTNRYSAKIYHKGSEYKKNDLKEHKRINKEKGRQYFKTEHYQAFADRILRYELTIRNAELNYLFKKHLFRKKCPHFRPYYKTYVEVENALQKNDRIAKRIGELPGEQKEDYKKEHPYILIPPDARKIHKWVSKLMNKKTLFKLAVDPEVEEYNKGMVNYECSEARFSRELLMLCFGKLIKFIKEYQIKELPQEDKIQKLIDQYNFKRDKKLPVRDMMSFYKDLLKFGSFKETVKFNGMSRSSEFRYKKRFKKIGITESNLIPLTEDGIPLAELNLRAYHYEHQFNPHFLTKKGFLDIR